MIGEYQPPAWMERYKSGERIGYAQAALAYGDYYGTDGSADMDNEIEERITAFPAPMISYASRTGTRRNLQAMREADWRILVSAKGVLRTEGMRYALDNGAWTAYQQGEKFDEVAFGRAVDLLGESADWIALPDIVMGGLASLDLSLRWLKRLKGINAPLLLVMQNGMENELDAIRELLSPSTGLFIGGDTQFKLESLGTFANLARRRHCHLHVGRVNSARRIGLCAAAGVNSIDGTSVSRFAKTLPRLDAALKHGEQQQDFFNPSRMKLGDIAFDCK
jgi:hypothetical protein